MNLSFCGNQPPPEWLVVSIPPLSQVSAVRLKLLTKAIASSIVAAGMPPPSPPSSSADPSAALASSVVPGALDYPTISKYVKDLPSQSDVKGVVSFLRYVLCGAADYDVDVDLLVGELFQLGLPLESAECIGRVHREMSVDVRNALSLTSFRKSRLKDVQWRVDLLLGSSGGVSVGEAMSPVGAGGGGKEQVEAGTTVHIKLTVDNKPWITKVKEGEGTNHPDKHKVVSMEMGRETFDMLFQELKIARGML